MNNDLQNPRLPPGNAKSQLAMRERLAIAALVTAVSLWIRINEVAPDRRHRG